MGSSKTSGRRRAPPRGEIRERKILEATERLLAAKPLAAISVDELAEAAGISRPTFYFYFRSKEAVVQTLIERLAESVAGEADPWLEGVGLRPAEVHRRVSAAFFQLWQEHGPLLRAVIQGAESVPELRAPWQRILGYFVERMALRIDRERQTGAALPGPPSATALATALVSMSERCCYRASAGGRPILDDSELVDTLALVWLRAIYGCDDPEQPSTRPTA